LEQPQSPSIAQRDMEITIAAASLQQDAVAGRNKMTNPSI
jgi:hypothetical protein